MKFHHELESTCIHTYIIGSEYGPLRMACGSVSSVPTERSKYIPCIHLYSDVVGSVEEARVAYLTPDTTGGPLYEGPDMPPLILEARNELPC